MKKIGIVSCYYVKNYGSMLQAYAIQKLIDNKGIYCENINYVKDNSINQKINNFMKLLDKNIIKVQFKNIKKKLIGTFKKNRYSRNFKIRNKKFEEFEKKYFKISKPYIGYEQLKQSSDDYDVFLLGSDQLWHPNNFYNHYFTLEFIPKDIPKITYSPSFGVSNIPKRQEEGTKRYLNRIEHISVREKSGQKIIKNLINREVPVVLDPTFMIDKKEWDEIQPKGRIYDQKYILCYFLGNNTMHREWVKKIKEKTGYTIIALPHIDEIVKSDEKYADIKMYDVGPAEMINLIKNAELVFTDSFHCTVFSVIYNKKFCTFNRFSNKAKESTNTRIKSILSILELENRLVTNYQQCEEIYNEEIDFGIPNKRLKEMKDKSFEYLNNALNNSLK